jgi:hypothetical protein
MSRRSGRTTRGILAALLCVAVFGLTVPAIAQENVDARAIMKRVFEQDTNHDLTMKANFQIYDRQGQSAKKEFTYMRIGAPGESRTLVAFTAPKEIRGVVLLSINKSRETASQYIYTPATQRVRSVAPQERSARFIGTDFTFEDISQHVLGDFTYALIDSSEKIDGNKTCKIEATPVDAGRSQYKYIYYWVAQDRPVILFAEFYDAEGKKVRTLHATDLKQEHGVWGARHTEMRTVADGTRTVLTIDSVKFNTKPDEKLFTSDGMADVLGKPAGK